MKLITIFKRGSEPLISCLAFKLSYQRHLLEPLEKLFTFALSVPLLSAAMSAVVEARPKDPIGYLADFLRNEVEEQRSCKTRDGDEHQTEESSFEQGNL